MSPIESILNAGLRGSAIAALLIISVALWRDYRSSRAAKLGAAFCVGVICLTIAHSPAFSPKFDFWHAPILAIAAGNAIVFWLFAAALFREDFRFRLWHGLAWVMLASIGLAQCIEIDARWAGSGVRMGLLQTISTLFFAFLAVVQAVSNWREDLVESRRRFRGWLIVGIGGYTIALTSATLLSGMSPLTILTSTFNALGYSAISLFVACQLLRAKGDDLFQLTATSSPESGSSDKSNTEKGFEAGSPDAALVSRLIALMEQKSVFREHGLTIGALADRLGIPEHKLRKLINQGLGYRSFTVFVNKYRIADAKAALADPAKAGLPVLTIALDSGFLSIGPFNRAFKADTGLTPTEFRRSGSHK